jgi:hypothetical protein
MQLTRFKSISKDIANDANLRASIPSINKSFRKDIHRKEINSDRKNKTVTFEGIKRFNPDIDDVYNLANKVKEKANYFLKIEIKK